MTVFVVTNPEDGWDCVTGVYKANSKEELKQYLLRAEGLDEEPPNLDDNNIISERTLKEVIIRTS